MSEESQPQKKQGLFSRVGNSMAEKGKSVIGYDSIKQGWDDIAESSKILNPFKKRRKPRREETFEQAYARNKLSETALARIYRNQKVAFFVSSGTAILCAFIAVMLLRDKGVISGLSAIGPLFVCLSLSISSSFKMFKIRRRDLGLSFDEWKASPGEWFPKEFVPLPSKKRKKRPSPAQE